MAMGRAMMMRMAIHSVMGVIVIVVVKIFKELYS
jgi:hypothetical protein